MTDFGFINFIGKLKSTWGDKFYPAERVSFFAEKLYLLSDEDLETLASELIGNCRTAPVLSDILLKAQSVLEQRYKERDIERKKELTNKQKEHGFCQYCCDSGLISATKKETRYKYSFRCPDRFCTAAQLNCGPHDIKWDDYFLKEYEPHFYINKDDVKLEKHESVSQYIQKIIEQSYLKTMEMVKEKNEAYQKLSPEEKAILAKADSVLLNVSSDLSAFLTLSDWTKTYERMLK